MNFNSIRPCFFTSISTNYIAKAVAWACSVRRVYPQTSIYIYVYNLSEIPLDQRSRLEQACAGYVGGEFGLRDPLRLMRPEKRYPYIFSLTEGCTAVKPKAALELLESYDNVTYMDPDTILYQDLDQGRTLQWDMQLIPHITDPVGTPGILNERLFLSAGVFNLGYFSVTRSTAVIEYLNWWHGYLEQYCHDSMQSGLYVDQRPCDFAPSFFENIDVVRHPGCNVAWWNLFSDRQLTRSNGEYFLIRRDQSFPLIFFHFSNYPGSSNPSLPVARPLPELMVGLQDLTLQVSWPEIGDLYRDYDQRCAECADLLPLISTYRQYRFSINGCRIPQLARILYREAYPNGTAWNPFECLQFMVVMRSVLTIFKRYQFSDVKSGLKRIAKASMSLLTPSLNRLDPNPVRQYPR